MKKLSKSKIQKSVTAYWGGGNDDNNKNDQAIGWKCNCGECGGTAVANGQVFSAQSLKKIRRDA